MSLFFMPIIKEVLRHSNIKCLNYQERGSGFATK